MQNIEKRCNGKITRINLAIATPFDINPFSVVPFETNAEKLKRNTKYISGMKKNALNRITFNLTPSGTFSCRPTAIDQNQHKNPMIQRIEISGIAIITNKGLSLTKKGIAIISIIIGNPIVIIKICHAFAFSNIFIADC